MPPHRGYTRPYSTLYNQFHHEAIKRVDLGRAKISHSHSAKKPRKYAQGGIGVSFALLTENDLAGTTCVDIDDRKKAPDKIATYLHLCTGIRVNRNANIPRWRQVCPKKIRSGLELNMPCC